MYNNLIHIFESHFDFMIQQTSDIWMNSFFFSRRLDRRADVSRWRWRCCRRRGWPPAPSLSSRTRSASSGRSRRASWRWGHSRQSTRRLGPSTATSWEWRPAPLSWKRNKYSQVLIRIEAFRKIKFPPRFFNFSLKGCGWKQSKKLKTDARNILRGVK